MALACVASAAATARAGPPLYDPVRLNIGINCQWQKRCMDQHERAMRHALKYVAKYHPPLWRVQQCNRNASRYRERVDWIGFNNCVRNAAVVYRPPTRQAPEHPSKHHRHRKVHHRR
jgi:hypothetical protein